MNQIRLVAYPDGTRAKAINIPETTSQKPPNQDEVLIMMLDDEIMQLRAELDEARKVIERHVEWLENVDHDYSNGNSAFGCDEGAVLGQRGESQLLASSHAYLASQTKDGKK
jgi:queuine/archaeosine tRNA-ribosyltransferase